MFRSFYRNLSPALLLILVALVACIAILILTGPYLRPQVVVVTPTPYPEGLPVTKPVTVTSEPEKLPVTTPVTATPDTGRLMVTRPVTFTSEEGKQRISLGSLRQPGQYVLQLANGNPPYSSHWLEWDYLALETGGRFLWWIGQDETSPGHTYTGSPTDEFCSTDPGTDCRTGFKVVEGQIDDRKFPKTLNDGEFPVIRIVFNATPEQTGTDLILTLSTLNSSHTDVKDFEMQVTLQGPF